MFVEVALETVSRLFSKAGKIKIISFVPHTRRIDLTFVIAQFHTRFSVLTSQFETFDSDGSFRHVKPCDQYGKDDVQYCGPFTLDGTLPESQVRDCPLVLTDRPGFPPMPGVAIP